LAFAMHTLWLWVPLGFVLVAVVHDLRRREVPDWISVLLLVWAVAATTLRLHPVGWLSALGGLALGFALSTVFFALGGLGAGDVKLLTALGAALGHVAVLFTLFWIALAGGLLALVALARGQRDLAYVPAIALGLFVSTVLRGGLLYALAP
jgi:prepilin peptidase CpaA